MTRISRWHKAMILAVFFHLVLWIGIGIFAFARSITPPQEELLEMSLVDDINKLTGNSGANSGGQVAALPQISIPEISPVKPPVTEEDFAEEIVKQVQTAAPQANISATAINKSVGLAAANSSNDGIGNSDGSGNGTGSGVGTGTGTGTGEGSGDGDGGGAISRPVVLSSVKPTYPSRARNKGIEGTVVLRVEIRENGRSGDVEVEESSGDDSLDDAALRVISKWRFIPAKKANGDSIACYTRVPITFRITD